MGSKTRIAVLNNHLNDYSAKIEPRAVYLWLTRDNVELRDRMLAFLQDPIFEPQHHLSLAESRQLTIDRLEALTKQRFFKAKDYKEDPLKFLAGLEISTFVDYSLSIKAGVHFTLCGGTICNLGTKQHHDKYLAKLDTLEERGCFAMTELGHGSNVMGIETTAVYQVSSQSFVISTPTNTASKFWIGGAGTSATISTVFAQLTVDGKWLGPHVFVVRLRDEEGNLMAGVRIKDNGPKAGLNGVDNGQIWFDNLKVPREAMLDRYASITPDGQYSSPIPSVSARFGTMVGGLTAGRILIAQGAVDGMKIGVSIAIRYACQRTQFQDKLLISYLTHQRRLIPALATAYAYHLTLLKVKAVHAKKDAKQAKLLHVMSSGVKAGATWSRGRILQDCRECCGGQGFLSANRIGPLKNDMDVDQTFEGDNTVMMQQVAKALIDAALQTLQRAESSASPAAPHISGPLISQDAISSLLQHREEVLTMQVASAMHEAGRSAASKGKKAAAEAVSDAYEDNLDTAVALGWAYVDRLCFTTFCEELDTAPSQARPALRKLALVYGLSRLEKSPAPLLASGALTSQQASELRLAVNQVCKDLSSQNGEALWGLCAGFGIPDKLLHAPIAFDWTTIGTSASTDDTL